MDKNFLAFNHEYPTIYVGKAESVQKFSDKILASLLSQVEDSYYTMVYELKEMSLSGKGVELKFYDVFLDEEGNKTDRKLLSYTLFVFDITDEEFSEIS
jgi:hypothetical protein